MVKQLRTNVVRKSKRFRLAMIGKLIEFENEDMGNAPPVAPPVASPELPNGRSQVTGLRVT